MLLCCVGSRPRTSQEIGCGLRPLILLMWECFLCGLVFVSGIWWKSGAWITNQSVSSYREHLSTTTDTPARIAARVKMKMIATSATFHRWVCEFTDESIVLRRRQGLIFDEPNFRDFLKEAGINGKSSCFTCFASKSLLISVDKFVF